MLRCIYSHAYPDQAHSAKMASQNPEDLFSKVERINSDINLFQEHVLQLHKEVTEVSKQPHIVEHKLADPSFRSRLGVIGRLNGSISAAIQSAAPECLSSPTLYQEIHSLQDRFSNMCKLYNNVEGWMRNVSKDVGGDTAPTNSGAAVTSHWERRMIRPVESSHPHGLTAQVALDESTSIVVRPH